MSEKFINDAGRAAATINILNEAARRNSALAALASSPLPDELKAEIFLSYKRLKRKQMLIIPLILIGWFIISVLVLAGLGQLTGLSPDLEGMTLLGKLLMGAFVVLPAVFIIMRLFRGDTRWDKYYAWYKNQKGAHLDTKSLLHLFDVEEETAAESNERVAAEMRSAGKTADQIAAVRKAREDYQLKKGLRPETEAETNERILRQMQENGYTDEQIDKAFRS